MPLSSQSNSFDDNSDVRHVRLSDDQDDIDDDKKSKNTNFSTSINTLSPLTSSTPNPTLDTSLYNTPLTEKTAETSKEDKIRAVVRTLDFDKAGVLSQFFLTWISPLVSLGKRYNLTYDDVPKAPSSSLVDKTLPEFQKKWIGRVRKTQMDIANKEHAAQFNSNTSPSLTTENFLPSFPQFLLQTECTDNASFTPTSPTQQKPLPNGTSGLVLDQHTNLPIIPPEVIQSHPVTKAISRPNARLHNDTEPKYPTSALISAFKWPLIWSAIGEAGFYACTIAQPNTIKQLAKFFKAYSEGDTVNSQLSHGVGWALLLGFITLLSAISTLFKHNSQIHFSTRASTATLSALFQKTLKIAPYSITNDEKLSSGALTNLVSADSMQIYNTVVFFHFAWAGPLTMAIVVYLMYRELGAAALITMFLMLLLIPYQLCMARIQRYYRKKLLALTDERLKFTSQLLSGLRVVKVYAWEKVLTEKLDEFRQRELSTLKIGIRWAWFGEAVLFFYPLVASYFTFMFYVKWNPAKFNTETVFLILAYLNTLRLPILCITQSFSAIIAQYVSSERIEHYLAKEEVPVTASQFEHSVKISLQNDVSPMQLDMTASFPTEMCNTNNNNDFVVQNQTFDLGSGNKNNGKNSNDNNNNNNNDNNNDDDILCELNNVDFYWSSLEQQPLQTPVLTNISLSLHRGEVIGLISSSGLGKTALISGILGSLYPQRARQFDGLKSIPNPVLASPSTQHPLHHINRAEVARAHCNLMESYLAPGRDGGVVDDNVDGDFDESNNNNNNNNTLNNLNNNTLNNLNNNTLNNLNNNNSNNNNNLNNSLNQSISPQSTLNTSSFTSSSYSTTDYMFSWSNTINLIPKSLINLKGRCGYSQQHPWLMNDTVRNNITLGLPFDPEWFQVVIDASSLRPDLEILIDADLTIVSDSGVSLSGGQAARVAFARCLYLVDYVDVVLLDDIFSAVDVYVAKNMFYNGVIGILKAKGKGVILSMNSHYDFLQSCDKTLIIDTLTEPNNDVLYWSTLYQKLSHSYEERLGQLAIEQKKSDLEEERSWGPRAVYNRMTGKKSKKIIKKSNDQNNENSILSNGIFKNDSKSSNSSSTNQDDFNGNNDSNPNAEYAKFEDDDDNNNDQYKNDRNAVSNTKTSSFHSTNLSLTNSSDSLTPAPSDSTTISGFRPPSGIVFCGTFDQLVQFDHPLIKTVTFSSPGGLAAQKAQVIFDPLALHKELLEASLVVDFKELQRIDEERVGDTGNGSANTSNDGNESDVKIIKTNQNLKHRKMIGQVDATKEAAQAERLKQKVDGAEVKGNKGEVVEKNNSKTPSQAQLSNKLLFYYLQGSRGFITMIVVLIILIAISLAGQAVRTYTDLLLVKWAEDASKQSPTHPTSYWLKTTGIGMLFSVTLYIAQVVLFIYIAIDASRFIHKESVKYIFHSAISYLDQTPIGTLLNYLSKDTEVLDTQLPENLLFVIQQFLRLSSVFIMATIASPLLFIPLVPALGVILYLRIGFHNTSVQLKRIESAALQPIYSLFSGVLKGGPTIRALQLQDKFNTRFQLLVDKYIRIKIIATQLERRFGAYLNCVTALYTCLLAVCAVLLRAHLNPNMAMLAITSALSLSSLQVAIRFWTVVTQALTSVHRLHELKSIPLEPDFYTSYAIKETVAQKQPMEFRKYQLQQEIELNSIKNLPKAIKKTKDGQLINLDYRIQQQHALSFWPWYGAISFKKLSLRYRPDLPLVINSLSINILPGQSVAVLGKTGAGKSTVFGALARLLQPCSGGIEIDGVDIEELGIGDLRSRISIIPQSPTLFSGTIRSNLDPLTRFTDNELWHSLKLVSMDERVRMLENGLYSVVQEMGSNFASSERQLFCIARALLSQPNVAADAKALVSSSSNPTTPEESSFSSPGGGQKSEKKANSANNSSDHYWSDDNFSQTESNAQEYTSIALESKIYADQRIVSDQYSSAQYIPPPPQASILLCDEITSSTDINADNVIQHTIRTAFSNSTLLIIAHRLSTIIDLDRVLILRSLTEEDIKNNTTSLLEFDVPFILLNNINSAFYNMCLGLGYDNFMILYQKAKDAFFATQKKEFKKWGTTLKYPEVEVITLPGFIDQFTQRLHQNDNHGDDRDCGDQEYGATSATTSEVTIIEGDNITNTSSSSISPHHVNQLHLDPYSFTYNDATALLEDSLKSPDAFARRGDINKNNHNDNDNFDCLSSHETDQLP